MSYRIRQRTDKGRIKQDDLLAPLWPVVLANTAQLALTVRITPPITIKLSVASSIYRSKTMT